MRKYSGASELETDESVGARIKARRIELQLSQAAVAMRLGISMQAYQQWERGKTSLSRQGIVMLAHILTLPVSFFFQHEAYASPASTGSLDTRKTLLAHADRIQDNLVRAQFIALIKCTANALNNPAVDEMNGETNS